MQHVYWDIETFSQVNLKDRGAHIYANDKTTGIFFFCYAIDDGEVQTWRPRRSRAGAVRQPGGYPVRRRQLRLRARHPREHSRPPLRLPADPAGATPTAPSAVRLPRSYPAELGLRCEALGLPFRKDPEARKAMMRLARPQTKKKQSKKPEDPAQRERDLALLLERCKSDVEATRACYNDPRLPPLLPEERALLLLDARINARGIAANIPFLEAARTLAVNERNAINTRLDHLTAGVIKSVDQVQKIREAVNARGQDLDSLRKRSVAAALAQPTGRLRARAAGPAPARRLRRDAQVQEAVGGRRPGRSPHSWCTAHLWRRTRALEFGRHRAQLQNLARNDRELPASLIDAVIAGDRADWRAGAIR